MMEVPKRGLMRFSIIPLSELKWVQSDEGLKLETSIFELFY